MKIGIRQMARKLTQKQEAYCQLVASGSNYSDAYRGAYNSSHMKDATVNRSAAALAKDHKIATRIILLNRSHQQRHNITVDTIKEGFLENIQLAKELNKPEAVNSSYNGLMKLYGLGVEKHKHEISAGEELMLRFFGSLPDTTGLPSERED
jgi:phage terminase small subunit